MCSCGRGPAWVLTRNGEDARCMRCVLDAMKDAGVGNELAEATTTAIATCQDCGKGLGNPHSKRCKECYKKRPLGTAAAHPIVEVLEAPAPPAPEPRPCADCGTEIKAGLYCDACWNDRLQRIDRSASVREASAKPDGVTVRREIAPDDHAGISAPIERRSEPKPDEDAGAIHRVAAKVLGL